MDWYLTGEDEAEVSALRRHVRDYLVRHGEDGEPFEAELVVQELLANAVEHASGPVWVRLSWLEEEPELEVLDLGPGFSLDPSSAPAPVLRGEEELPDLDGEGGRGLFLVSHLARELEVVARTSGGTRVRARLPVRRAASPSFPVLPPPTSPLPSLEEAGPEGAFGKEPFLRALVVQLSQAVEHTAGPAVGEQVVAEVGTAVGGQMEAAYRAARGLAERLTPEQLADCYVRLKHAIDGEFSVLEIGADRIVLVNRRCPFGDVVRKAPALCRMTSSVFGGIAARNSDQGAAVVLEERIAVGDPGCRVVVHLGPAPGGSARFAHRYGSPADGTRPEGGRPVPA